MKAEILIVDDEADIRELIADILSDEGYTPRTLADGSEALEAVRARCPDLMILDIWLNGQRFDGLELLDILKRDYPLLPIIMISGHGTIETAVSSVKRGAADFIEKPFQTDRLLMTVERALSTMRLEKENALLRARVDLVPNLIGVSKAMQKIRASVQKQAQSHSRILIHGPAGVGKQLVARTICHQAHPHAPFAMVDCRMLGLEPDHGYAKIFGREEKVELGPQAIFPGILEQARGGVAYFHHVEALPGDVQGPLQRALVDEKFYRADGTASVELRARIMASSLMDPVGLATSTLRPDLLQRLKVEELAIPALSARPEDIRPLTEHFLDVAAEGWHLPRLAFDEDAIAFMESYGWPGNVRQLQNLVKGSLIFATEQKFTKITREDLRFVMQQVLQQKKDVQLNDLLFHPLRQAREEFERVYLKTHYKRFAGNMQQLAGYADLERTALYRKLKMLGVDYKNSPETGAEEA